VPQCTEQFGHLLDQRGDLPRLEDSPAPELVDAIKAEQHHQDSTSVINDANDHLDLAVDLPELSNPGVLWVGFVELMRFGSVHQSIK